MKRPIMPRPFRRIRRSFPGTALAAVLAAAQLLLVAAPASADKATFTSQAHYYQRTGADFMDRLDSLSKYETSPSGLNAWSKDASAKILAYDTNAKSILQQALFEAHSLYDANKHDCWVTQTEMMGPYDTGIGWGTVRLDYSLRTSTLRSVLDHLEATENSLLQKISDANLHGKSVDNATTNLMIATRYAANTLASQYTLMSREEAYIDNVVAGMQQELAAPACSGQATPAPSATNKTGATPSPSPKTSPKPATPKPVPTPSPPSTPCKTGWQWWPGFGWRCVS